MSHYGIAGEADYRPFASKRAGPVTPNDNLWRCDRRFLRLHRQRQRREDRHHAQGN